MNLVNFEKLRFRAIPLLSLNALFWPSAAHAANLESNTSGAWEEYIQSATTRMEQRLNPGKSFLWSDETPERLAKVRSGEIVVSPVGVENPKRIPSGLIHDWVGAVYIDHATIADAMQVVRDYARYKELYQPTVVDSKVVANGETEDHFSMLLMNKSLLLKTAFDADYDVCYMRVDEGRMYGVSRTTRVQEMQDYGSSAQQLLPEGQGSGVIWSLIGITRYMERDGGLYIELEAIGLSRDIPASIRWLVEPMVRRISRRALLTSLEQTEKAVRAEAELASVRLSNERGRGDRGNSKAFH